MWSYSYLFKLKGLNLLCREKINRHGETGWKERYCITLEFCNGRYKSSQVSRAVWNQKKIAVKTHTTQREVQQVAHTHTQAHSKTVYRNMTHCSDFQTAWSESWHSFGLPHCSPAAGLDLTWPISDSTAVWIFQAGGGRNRGRLAHLRLRGGKWGWTSGSLWASQPVNRSNKSTRGARWSKNRSRWFPFWTRGGGHVWAQCCI